MKNTYSPEIRQRAVRLYQEQRSEYPTQWAATVSIASKFGCTPETLRTWIKKFEADLADNGAAADQAQRIKQLERDNKELQRANEILRKAAAFFAQAELDRKEAICWIVFMNIKWCMGSSQFAEYCRLRHPLIIDMRKD